MGREGKYEYTQIGKKIQALRCMEGKMGEKDVDGL